MRSDKILTITALLTVSTFADAAGPEWQPINDLVDAAQQFVMTERQINKGDFAVDVSTPDPRLKLKRCMQPLETSALSAAPGQRRMTIQVRCSAPKPWKIYLQATIESFEPIVVLAQNLPRGSLIKSSDLKIIRRSVGALSGGYLTRIEPLIGQRTLQTLSAGSVLQPNQVKQSVAVKRGQTVMLVTENSGINIRMAGTATADAATGARVSVRNKSSGILVEGIVLNANTVRIGN